MEHAVPDASERITSPAAVPTIVAVQTVVEDRGFPAHVRGDEPTLPPAGVPLLPIARLLAMPLCELISWPLVLLQWLRGAPVPQPSHSSQSE